MNPPRKKLKHCNWSNTEETKMVVSFTKRNVKQEKKGRPIIAIYDDARLSWDAEYS